jgi:type I restriction enzyme S subunit
MSEFPGNWEYKCIGEFASRVRRKNSSGKCQDVMTISAVDGLVSQRDYFNKIVASKNTEGYTLLRRNDFAYNKSYSVGYPVGAARRLKTKEKGIVSPLYICFELDEGCLDLQYADYLFDSDWFIQAIYGIAKEGARSHGLLNIGIEEFFSASLPIPPLPEQKKIAEILSGIDIQRQALAKKVVNALMLRNALGEKIFSSLDGERVPLGELCNPKQWQTISTNQLTTSGYPVYGANGKIGYFTEYNHREPVLAVTCRGATCGNLTLVPAFSYVTGNSMCLDNPREDTSPEYLFQFLAWRGLKDVISGSAQPQITRSPLQAVEVVLPSKEKQDKIVSTLESVNNAENIMNIALGRLDLLKQAIAADLLSGRKRVSV